MTGKSLLTWTDSFELLVSVRGYRPIDSCLYFQSGLGRRFFYLLRNLNCGHFKFESCVRLLHAVAVRVRG